MLVRQADPSSAPVSAVTESALTAKVVMPAASSIKTHHCTYALIIISPLASQIFGALQAAGSVQLTYWMEVSALGGVDTGACFGVPHS